MHSGLLDWRVIAGLVVENDPSAASARKPVPVPKAKLGVIPLRPMSLVRPYFLFTNSPADWIAGGSAILLLGLALAYAAERPGRKRGRYDPQLAWLRAGVYFCVALLLSWCLGVMQSLLEEPLVRAEQWQDPFWIAYTLAYLSVLWIAYKILWPRGTFTDGRRRHPILATGYGLVWGLCHGQVFLCFWALAEWSGLANFWAAALTFLLLSGYNFVYHQFFWDVQVSPPHNYEAWNMKKVLYCHTPNLVLGLIWLAIWGNFGLWLLFQAGCLAVSAHAMRFPAWYDDYSAVAGETR